MSALKKKKLDSAIQNLFSSSRGKPVKDSTEQQPAEGIESVAVLEMESEAVAEVNPESIPESAIANQVEAQDEKSQETAMQKTAQAVQLFVEANPVQKISAPQPLVTVQKAEVVKEAPTLPAAAPSAGLADSETLQMVIFTLEEQFYGIDIALVESIIKLQAITRLPHVPYYTLGLTNLRGKVVPVFSLRRRFGLSEQEANKANRIIIIRHEQEEVGLVVDAVSEVETILRSNIEPAPAMVLTISTQYIHGIAKLDERLIIYLDVAKVIGTDLRK